MKIKTILFSLIAMLAITALIFQSCKKDDPNDPIDPTPPIYTNGQGEIGTIGGTVMIDDGNSPIDGASIMIPEGCLDGTVTISIKEGGITNAGGHENIKTVKFLPEGLEFLKVVEITLPWSKTNQTVSNTRAYFLNDNGTINLLEVISVDTMTKQTIARTSHFSLFFSDEVSTFTDERDGQTYTTVNIGNQIWMSENMNIGIQIDGANEQTDNSTIEKYCYDNNEDNCDTYGGLYLWDEMMQYEVTVSIQGICPTGWHIPSDEEWKILEMALGMSQSEADSVGFRGTVAPKMKSKSGWNSSDNGDGNGTNSSGFNALPAGVYSNDGSFRGLHTSCSFPSSSEVLGAAWRRYLDYQLDYVNRAVDNKYTGRSVRCIKD